MWVYNCVYKSELIITRVVCYTREPTCFLPSCPFGAVTHETLTFSTTTSSHALFGLFDYPSCLETTNGLVALSQWLLQRYNFLDQQLYHVPYCYHRQICKCIVFAYHLINFGSAWFSVRLIKVLIVLVFCLESKKNKKENKKHRKSTKRKICIHSWSGLRDSHSELYLSCIQP